MSDWYCVTHMRTTSSDYNHCGGRLPEGDCRETCPRCGGTGEVAKIGKPPASHPLFGQSTPCGVCRGLGHVALWGWVDVSTEDTTAFVPNGRVSS